MLTLFYLLIICLFIYIYTCIFIYIYLFVYIYIFICVFIIRYNLFFFVMLFILRFFFDLVIFIYIMSIHVCVNRTIDGDLLVVLDGSSFWADWHHCILYSTRHSSLPTIRIIMIRMYNFFSEPKCD